MRISGGIAGSKLEQGRYGVSNCSGISGRRGRERRGDGDIEPRQYSARDPWRCSGPVSRRNSRALLLTAPDAPLWAALRCPDASPLCSGRRASAQSKSQTCPQQRAAVAASRGDKPRAHGSGGMASRGGERAKAEAIRLGLRSLRIVAPDAALLAR